MQPKMVDLFLLGATPEELFVKSKAKSATFLRNSVVNAGYVSSNLRQYLQKMDTKPSGDDISTMKAARKLINDFLSATDGLDI